VGPGRLNVGPEVCNTLDLISLVAPAAASITERYEPEKQK